MSATTDTPSTIEELPDDAPTGIVPETDTSDAKEPATDAENATPDPSTDADDALLDDLSAQLAGAQANEGGEDNGEVPAPPPEEPMPSPAECLTKHLGDRLTQAMAKRSDDELKPLRTLHSLEEMGVAAETLQRAIIPHLRNVQMMQQYQPRKGTRAQKQHWQDAFHKMRRTYEDANHEYEDQRDELRGVVRDFLHALEDKEQRDRQAYARDHKPFSKGKRGHFWRAVEADDPDALLKTLDDSETVKQARWGVFRPSRDADAVDDRPLLCLLAGNRRGVPTGGAVRCIEALLQAYPDAFSKADAEEAVAFVEGRGLSKARAGCVRALGV
jgi:hypothetical protein